MGKKSLYSKARKQESKQNALKYPLPFHCEEREDGHFIVISKISMCGYKHSANLYFKSGPLPPRDWLRIHSPPARPESPPYCLGVRTVFCCRDFHFHHDMWVGAWAAAEADCTGWRTTWTQRVLCVHSYVPCKKFSTVAVSGKFQMRNIWSPRQCFNVLVAPWFQAPGKIPSRPSR